MNILLLSMPDSFEHMPTVAIRMPNGALTSLAGNVDPHHRVAVADLILVQRRIRETIERLVREVEPDLVGLSVMTFQRHTALRIIELEQAGEHSDLVRLAEGDVARAQYGIIYIDEIDKIDLKGMEPQVAEKIERLRAEMKSNPKSAAAWGKLAMNLDAADL